jgi:hypothetical protein
VPADTFISTDCCCCCFLLLLLPMSSEVQLKGMRVSAIVLNVD